MLKSRESRKATVAVVVLTLYVIAIFTLLTLLLGFWNTLVAILYFVGGVVVIAGIVYFVKGWINRGE